MKTDELVPELIEAALATLPIPRRMRWGAGDAEFVRPVHWVVLLHGSKAIKASDHGHRGGQKVARPSLSFNQTGRHQVRCRLPAGA